MVAYISSVGQTVFVVTLAAMSVDQWIFVHRALTYYHYITLPKITSVNIAIWILSFLLYTPFFFNYLEFEYIIYTHLCLIHMLKICNRTVVLVFRFITYVSCFALIFLCNIWTCHTAHIHMKKIQNQNNVLHSDQQLSFNTARPMYKHFKTTLLIIIGFILCSAPLFVIQMTYSLTKMNNINKTLLFYAEWSMISGSYINFFVCIFTNRKIRKTLIRILNNKYRKITAMLTTNPV